MLEIKHIPMHKSLLYLLICPGNKHFIKCGGLKEEIYECMCKYIYTIHKISYHLQISTRQKYITFSVKPTAK